MHGNKNRRVTLKELFESPYVTDILYSEANAIREQGDRIEELMRILRVEKIGLSDRFGNSEIIGINQKTLTRAISCIWEKLEDITGERYRGLSFIVTPDYFTSTSGCDVKITATTQATVGVFENLQLYCDGELFYEGNNVEFYTNTIHIDDTAVLMCKATILGIEYTKSRVVRKCSPLWIGGASEYGHIMSENYLQHVYEGLTGSYNITMNAGDHLCLIVSEDLNGGFVRAYNGGVEVPLIR